jgi:two-component system LytT family response regulator
MMIKTLIIEDELKTRDSLIYLLEKYCPEISICSSADTFESGYNEVLAKEPELIFMDIQLNSEDGTGVDLVSALHGSGCAVIFISGFKDYAVDAFRLDAVDYLLKPIRIDQLIAAVAKAKKYLELKKSGSDKDTKPNTFHVPVQHGFIIIRHKDIIRCEADGAYTHVYMKDKNERITASINIGVVEKKLGADFFRIHKSHIINRDSIVSYSKGDGLILKMTDGSDVPVSKAHKDSFFKWLG